MKNSKQSLYESIMKNVSKEIKRSLNESFNSNIIRNLVNSIKISRTTHSAGTDTIWLTDLDLNAVTDNDILIFTAGDKKGIKKIHTAFSPRSTKNEKYVVIFYKKDDTEYEHPLAISSRNSCVSLFIIDNKEFHGMIPYSKNQTDKLKMLEYTAHLYNFILIDLNKFSISDRRWERYNKKHDSESVRNNSRASKYVQLLKDKMDIISLNINDNIDDIKDILFKNVNHPENLLKMGYARDIALLINKELELNK